MSHSSSAPAALAALLCGLLVLSSAAAQPAPQDWYQVEVIVFRHWAGADTEQFQPEAPPPAFQRLTVLRRDGSRAFRRLGSGELALQGARKRLERSPDYEVLEHFGWEQPGLPEAQAISIALPLDWQPSALTFNAERHSLGVPVITPEAFAPEEAAPTAQPLAADSPRDDGAPGLPEVEPPGVFDALPRQVQLYGTLTLYRGRYLHIDADLRYRLPRYQPSWTAREVAMGPPLYVLDQRRRMRSDELHYLDHPAIGLLVKVTPLDSATQEGADPVPD